ncbi:MAG: M1 family metallopeptidase [Chitinophagaceae bacterium]|nr:M1 family metallopeptidase [Chitinophagaceae bacterium]MCZ2396071.1 M1 family metallopeptidase [Chitinophagales bacterium]
MRSILLLMSGILMFVSLSYGQELYMPRNIKKAIANGTRTTTGQPGAKYWQNKGKYDMQIKVTPETGIVSGSESIVYSNNSPDTLRSLAIRFVNNVNKKNSPRGSYMPDAAMTTGLVIESFAVNGTTYNVNAQNWGTVGTVRLKEPILPHSSATVNISWNYPLAPVDGREGRIDSVTFYAAYSYPRISVYDDYNGWDMLDHTGRQEFYNDFNDYTYAVSVPKNYIVWGTGDLLNPDEVLQPEYSKRLKHSYTADEVIHVATPEELQAEKVTAQNDWNTWKFSANHITDVCFALSKHYVWDAASVVVDPKTNRRASVQSAYNEKAPDFKHYVEWTQHALTFFSTKWPGVPYPFSKMTSFQGHADMEYPMMVNDGSTANLRFAQLVLDHEVAHTYFPFYMGTNETRYAYMDEGWATTFEYLAGIEEFGKENADNFYKMFRVARYISDPSTEQDQPIITMSTQVSGAGYGNNSYGKASLSYLALKDLLGDSLFKKALHHYMDLWNGKHPIPWDYFYAMNAGSGMDLNWFFNNWFFTNNYIDLKIGQVKKSGDGYALTVRNVGGFAIPFDIKITYTDGKTDIMHQTPAVWKKNSKEQVFKISTPKAIKAIELDGGIFLDYTPADNSWKN